MGGARGECLEDRVSCEERGRGQRRGAIREGAGLEERAFRGGGGASVGGVDQIVEG